MKQKLKISTILFALLVVFTNKSSAQVEKMASYIFASDSVAGFDETNASAAALANACYGFEYKVFMYKAQRDFIKKKYNIKSAPVQATLFQNMQVSRGMAIGGTCDNEDFELASGGPAIIAPGAVQGWTIQSGSNSNSCNPPTLTGFLGYTVYTSPTIDPKIPTPIASYFDAASNVQPAGSCFIKLSQVTSPAGQKAVKLSKAFIVQPTNALFQYAYLPVVEDGGHGCCSQPGFNIRITVTNTTTNISQVLACPQISVAVPSAACFFTPPPSAPVFTPAAGPSGWSYHNWAASAIDLTPYLGNLVRLDVVVVDCDAGGHGAYAYFDARCAPMAVVGNGSPFPAGTPNILLPTCGAQSATICAPDGLGPYTWAGPNVVAPYNTPLVSNQCMTVGVSADFSLTMNPPGSCSPIVRVITVTITPAPYILASVLPAACGATNAVVSWTAAGSASVNPTIIWSPLPTATASSASNLGTATFSTGIGVVTVTALDPLGCKVTATVNILPTPPTPTVLIQNVTGSQSITCNTPTIDFNAVSGYTNSLNYYWASNSFTSSSQSINVVSSATLITLTVTDPNTGCAASATTAVRVNTTIPLSSVSPVNQFINCGPGVVATATGVAISPTVNVSHQWFGPGGVANAPSGGQISIYNPYINGSDGINTYVLTNLINGCTTTKTIQVVSTGGAYPSFSLTSLANFTLGCGTTSVGDINIVGANTNPPPGGGVVSYTMLPPAYTGTNYATSVTVPSYTVNSPGTYTMIVKDNGNQCETRIPVSIIQNTFGPDISITVATQTLSCFTPSVVLQGSSTTPNIVYTWKKTTLPPLVTNSVLPVTTTSAGASVPSATLIDTYTLTIQDKSNTCSTTSLVTIYQNTRPPKPGIAFSYTALTCAIYSVNATNNSTTGVLPNTFFGTAGLNAILWQGPSPQQDLQNNSTYLGFTAGLYTLTVRDMNNGCTSSTTALLGDNRVYPVIQTSSTSVLDCGAGTAGARLTSTVVGLTATQVLPHWDVPATAITSTVDALNLTTDAIGEYILTVETKTNGCASKAFVTVKNGSLTADFSADRTTGYAPLTVNFTNNSASSIPGTATQSITSIWSFGNGTTKTTTVNTTVANTSAIYTQPGTYTVTMYAVKGSCVDTFYKVIKIDIPSKLEVPNVFTPNGDNSNDLFFVKTSNLSEITAMIFDRWGNKIYELTTDKGNIAWDGKTQTGKEAPDGTYFYVITAKGKDGQDYNTKGTVSLYR